MWENLSIKDKDEYKKMILAFARFSELFSQKKNTDESFEEEDVEEEKRRL